MSAESWAIQRRQMYLGRSGDNSAGSMSMRSRSDCIHRASAVGLLGLIASDLLLSFVWAWGMHHAYAAVGDQPGPKAAIYVAGRFLLAWLADPVGGGSTNPLTALAQASLAGGGSYGVFATSCLRVPAQVVGNMIGLYMFAQSSPGYTPGPFLEVGIYLGAVVQSILAFVMAMVYLNLTDMTLFAQTFISTMTRMVLNQIGTGLTNGWLNPASAFGWAYLGGIHTTKEHLVVYWIAPILATLIAVQFQNSFIQRAGSGSRWKSD